MLPLASALSFLSRTTALLVGLALAGIAHAEGAPARHEGPLPVGLVVQGIAPMTGNMVPITVLEFFKSTTDESEIDFLKRVGKYMQRYSRSKHVETCASVWRKANGEMATQVTTNGGHTTCVVILENPAGEEYTMDERSIHSHPYGLSEAKLTPTDELLTGQKAGTGVVIYNTGFSPQDKESGPGFLISNKHLLENNNGTIKDYGSVVE